MLCSHLLTWLSHIFMGRVLCNFHNQILYPMHSLSSYTLFSIIASHFLQSLPAETFGRLPTLSKLVSENRIGYVRQIGDGSGVTAAPGSTTPEGSRQLPNLVILTHYPNTQGKVLEYQDFIDKIINCLKAVYSQAATLWNLRVHFIGRKQSGRMLSAIWTGTATATNSYRKRERVRKREGFSWMVWWQGWEKLRLRIIEITLKVTSNKRDIFYI